jgi:actin-related protein 6
MGKQMQVLVADQVDAVHNGSSLNYIRPFDRGYVTNWGVEIDVWNRIFAKDKIVPKNIGCLVVTEPLFNPETLQNDFNEVVFEEFEFDRYLRRPSAWFSAYHHAKTASIECENPNCSVVVESGFSFTHSVPFINGRLRPKGEWK